MIDKDRTWSIFGYDSDELSYGSRKKVVVVCEECGKVCKTCHAKTNGNREYWETSIMEKLNGHTKN